MDPSTKPTTYVALLRGINVGGQNVIKMDELRATFEELGLSDVRTHIQSGNVVFRSPDADKHAAEPSIEEGAVTERTGTRRRSSSGAWPSTGRCSTHSRPAGEATHAKHNVIFLRPAIDRETLIDDLGPKPGIETVRLCPRGAALVGRHRNDLTRSSDAQARLPGREYQEMTVRNLNTTKKLFELMQEVDAGEDDDLTRPGVRVATAALLQAERPVGNGAHRCLPRADPRVRRQRTATTEIPSRSTPGCASTRRTRSRPRAAADERLSASGCPSRAALRRC